jgi:hypothetical protein
MHFLQLQDWQNICPQPFFAPAILAAHNGLPKVTDLHPQDDFLYDQAMFNRWATCRRFL